MRSGVSFVFADSPLGDYELSDPEVSVLAAQILGIGMKSDPCFLVTIGGLTFG